MSSETERGSESELAGVLSLCRFAFSVLWEMTDSADMVGKPQFMKSIIHSKVSTVELCTDIATV